LVVAAAAGQLRFPGGGGVFRGEFRRGRRCGFGAHAAAGGGADVWPQVQAGPGRRDLGLLSCALEPPPPRGI
jgi:hypothetical protein